MRRRVRRQIRSPRGAELTGSEFGVFSQNGEDGVLCEVFRRIGTRGRQFVEFGAGTGEQANCVLLADLLGWHGVFIEADPAQYCSLATKYRSNPRVRTINARVTASTIEGLLARAGVPPVFDLLSVDTDGNDFWIWQAIRSFTARVVVIEYNGNLDLKRRLVMPEDDSHHWDGTDYFGASLGAYTALAKEKGYELLHTDRTGANAFYVLREEVGAFSDLTPAVPSPANYFCHGLRLPPDPEGRPFLDLQSGQLIRAERPHTESVSGARGA